MPGCGARPTRSSTVGITSTVDDLRARCGPRSPHGVRTIERHVLRSRRRRRRCACSRRARPRLSPWSARSTRIVRSQTPAALEPRDEPAHHLVGVGHLAEVRLARVAREEGLRRLVGRVGVVEVDPGEELLRLHALEPREREVHHLVALLLHGAEVDDLVLREVEAVGVVVEALVEAPPRVEHPGADEGAGRVARLPSSARRASSSSASRKKPPLSRTPWCGGMRPVKIDACEGSVIGTVGRRLLEEDALARRPRRCSASRRPRKP